MVTIRAIACPPQEILPAANTWEAAIGYETAASRGFQPIVWQFTNVKHSAASVPPCFCLTPYSTWQDQYEHVCLRQGPWGRVIAERGLKAATVSYLWGPKDQKFLFKTSHKARTDPGPLLKTIIKSLDLKLITKIKKNFSQNSVRLEIEIKINLHLLLHR